MKKHSLFLVFCLTFSFMLQAQTNKTINLTAGNLYASLTADERNLITDLTLTGTIDARDFKTMGDNMARLAKLDISGVHITAYSGTDGPFQSGIWDYPANTIPVLAFRTFYSRPLSSIVFPSTLTAIGLSAFEGCSVLKALTIPSSVKVIGGGAFRNCIGLESLTIPSSVVSIEPYAFFGCTGLSFLDLPSTITSLGENAFYGCNGLTSVTMPSSLTSIGTAFSFCTGLTQIKLPDLATTIEFGAFQGCTGLTSITIPQSVTKILGYAFSNCSALTSINIPSGVNIIGEFLFSNCSKLASVTVKWAFPPVIHYSIFYMINRTTCTLHVPYGATSKYREDSEWNEFKNIVETSNGIYISTPTANVLSFAGSTATIDLTANVSWTASSDQTWLAVSPGSGTANNQLTFTAQANPTISSRTAKVTISSTGFESKTITITQNGADVLLSNVTPGSLLTLLPSDDLKTMTNLILKGTIDARDFLTIRDKMPKLTDLDLSGVTIAAYEGSEGTIGAYNFNYAANTIPQYAFLNYEAPSKLTSIVLPGSVIGIENNAFGWGLISLKVNNPLPIVFDYYSNAFSPIQQNCTLNIPYGSASRYATANRWKDFAHAKEASVGFNLSSYNDTITGAEGTIHSVDITANVAWTVSSDQDWLVVDPAAGSGNQKLTFTAGANELFTNRQATVTITGAGVSNQTTIITQDIQPQPEKILEVTAGGLAAALNQDELNTISILTLTGTIDARDFKTMRDKMPLLAKLNLSGVSIVAYSGPEGTSLDYGINYGANSIPETAFYGPNPYAGKNSLTSIIFPSTLTSIENFSFGYCKGIKEIAFPSSVTTIGEYAFYYCEGLTSVSIPSPVKTIGVAAFRFCTSLSSVTLPSSVTSIGSSAFSDCVKLNSLTVNWTTPLTLSTHQCVFYNVNTTTIPLNVPYGTLSRYAAAEQWKDFINKKEMSGFLLSANSARIGAIEGSTSTLDIASNVTWTVTSDQDWLSVSPASGTGLGQKLTFTAAANSSFVTRTATVTVSAPGIESQMITSTQSPARIEIIAGELSSVFTVEELKTIDELTIKGTIDARDFKTMRDKMPLLAMLDLSEATIAAYNGSEGTSMNYTTDYPENEIPEYAFYKNSPTPTPTSIIFPPSITSIGRDAFYYCVGLTDILIPSMVTIIKREAFYNCSGLKSVFLPPSIIKIEGYCFAYCNKLASIIAESSIPPDLINSNSVFYGVDKSLCVLNVPYKSASAYRNAYQWKDFLNIVEATKGFKLNPSIAMVNGAAGSKATIGIDANIEWTATSDQTWLAVNPGSGTDIQTLTLTADENPSFLNPRTAYVTVSATGLVSRRITVTQSAKPQPPKTLEMNAGGLVSALTAEELATMTDLTLTGTIDARDFKTMRDNMPLLAKLNLSRATIVAYNGTEGTSSNGNIDYPANTIPEYAFVNTTYGQQGKSNLTSIGLPESLTAIGQYAFSFCLSLTDVIIPSSVTDLGDYAFYNCSKISQMTVPAAINTIGIQALGKLYGSIIVDPANQNYMSSNNTLFNKTQSELIQCSISYSGIYNIPPSVRSINAYAFSDCSSLATVTIPSSVVSIGKNAFFYCGGLSTLTIPSSVTFIGESAFSYCYGLKSVYVNSITPIHLSASPRVFYQIYNCTLFVPIGTKSIYQSANQWKDFQYIVEVNPDLIANAGADKTIDEGTLLVLEGSVSVNTSGKPITYKWTAPEGITLSSNNISNPTFTAPEVTNYTYFTFSLTISDGLNFSTADPVTITVTNVMKAPVANAGTDQTVNENSLVTLDGSASFDHDNNSLYYEWTGPSGINLISNNSSKPTFIAPEVTTDAKITFYLKVRNVYNYYTTDTVVITVKQVNKVPTANAGNIQYQNEGGPVTLNGTASKDPEGDILTYQWTAPAGITLNSTTLARPSFTAPEVNTDTYYTFSLVVNDGNQNSAISEVTVVVRQVWPVLKLRSNANNLTKPVHVNYKLFMKADNAFIQKIDTFAVTGELLYLNLEVGDWIVLAAPARDSMDFVPTYVGNVLKWNEAEIITMTEKIAPYREISCINRVIANKGVGQISGLVFEKTGSAAKSMSISKESRILDQPIQIALVRLYQKGSTVPVASEFTDSQGAYQFKKLELSDYEIVIELPGFIQSDKYTIGLSDKEPVATAYFALNTIAQVITDNSSIQVAMIKIYPNPTVGEIHIGGLLPNLKNKLSIYSIDGNLVMEKTIHSTHETIDISHLVSGTYLFVINKQTFKIVKK